MDEVAIYNMDCLDGLRMLEDNSVDLIVTDPPYGTNFSPKTPWDKKFPRLMIWEECLRVLKSGAFAFIMSSPRLDTMGRAILIVEIAGFQTNFTPVFWMRRRQSMAKCEDIPLAIDKKLGVKRKRKLIQGSPFKGGRLHVKPVGGTTRVPVMVADKTPITDLAKIMKGSYAGFHPTPCVEVIMVAMKPLEKDTYVEQAMDNRHGVTWLDDCRDSDGRLPANLISSDNSLGELSADFSLEDWYECNCIYTPSPQKKEKTFGGVENPHFTPKPIALCSYLVTLGSREGDLVVDPFLGGGSTALSCIGLNRKCIGFEIDQTVCEVARKKVDYALSQKHLNI